MYVKFCVILIVHF